MYGAVRRTSLEDRQRERMKRTRWEVQWMEGKTVSNTDKTKLVNTIESGEKSWKMRKQRNGDRKQFAKSMSQYHWRGKEVMRVG